MAPAEKHRVNRLLIVLAVLVTLAVTSPVWIYLLGTPALGNPLGKVLGLLRWLGIDIQIP